MSEQAINIGELFKIFTSELGHRVIKRRQDEWANTPEGWEHHALNHMAYWTLRDLKKLTHAKVCQELENKQRSELLQEILTALIELKQTTIEDVSNQLTSQAESIGFDYSIQNPFLSNQTIEQLLQQGYEGVDHDLVNKSPFAAAAQKFRDKVKWTLTQPDEDGDVGLMTPNKEGFNQLLEFMLNKFGWCPTIYSFDNHSKFIFKPQNEHERTAIELAISGECGWQGSLYRLEYFAVEKNELCLIFATKPADAQQEWLLVKFDRKKQTRAWSVHLGTLEQVYYLWAEQIGILEPRFEPTTDEILDLR